MRVYTWTRSMYFSCWWMVSVHAPVCLDACGCMSVWMCMFGHSMQHTFSPWLAYPRPSCLHTTMASLVPQPSPHSSPQRWVPLGSAWSTSTRPSYRDRPPPIRTCAGQRGRVSGSPRKHPWDPGESHWMWARHAGSCSYLVVFQWPVAVVLRDKNLSRLNEISKWIGNASRN